MNITLHILTSWSFRRWFGIVLLPIVSFSADATVAITYFVRQSLKVYLGFRSPLPPESLAQARAIDMSIQFLLFWTPFLTLLGWWTNKPMTLLFGRRHLPSPRSPC
jgi:Ca2+:H+ antiporter